MTLAMEKGTFTEMSCGGGMVRIKLGLCALLLEIEEMGV